MDDEEQPILSVKTQLVEDLSIEELENRITDLEVEIEACRNAIKAKQSVRSAADALFGSKD